jgi:hypothetical protein
MKQFPYSILVPEKLDASFILTVRIKLENQAEAGDILSYLRSQALKDDIHRSWMIKNASNSGMEVKGGPRPIFKIENDRDSGVVAYECDFRITQRI